MSHTQILDAIRLAAEKHPTSTLAAIAADATTHFGKPLEQLSDENFLDGLQCTDLLGHPERVRSKRPAAELGVLLELLTKYVTHPTNADQAFAGLMATLREEALGEGSRPSEMDVAMRFSLELWEHSLRPIFDVKVA